jgi:hypothetical protein
MLRYRVIKDAVPVKKYFTRISFVFSNGYADEWGWGLIPIK